MELLGLIHVVGQDRHAGRGLCVVVTTSAIQREGVHATAEAGEGAVDPEQRTVATGNLAKSISRG